METTQLYVWHPIETAPKDGTQVLAYRDGAVEMMHWNADKYANRPEPFWDSYSGVPGKRELRRQPPSHWMPLPAAPDEGQ